MRNSNIIISTYLWLVIIAGIILRILIYGDPRLSLANNDTIGFIASAQSPINSWEIFTGKRLFTTNLLYKLFEPDNGYQIIANSPGHTTRRVFQPGFENITIIQFSLSVLGWSFLSLTVAKFINSPLMKLVSVITILLFGFTPQIAEWDSLLLSESLTISLFILQLSLLIRMVFRLLSGEEKSLMPLLSAWMIVFIFWIFTRDTNLYSIPVTILLIMTLWRVGRISRIGYPIGIASILVCTFFLGWITSQKSIRPVVEISHVYNSDLLPFPGRVAILKSWGMPAPGSPGFQTWLEVNGVTTFIKFMITHPGYVTIKISRDILFVFGDNLQPYFKIPELGGLREILIGIGDVFHPKSATPILIGIIILVGIFNVDSRNLNINRLGWGLIGGWLFMMASVTVFISIMASSYGLHRHAQLSTMAFRLFMWVFLIVTLDFGMSTKASGRELIGMGAGTKPNSQDAIQEY